MQKSPGYSPSTAKSSGDLRADEVRQLSTGMKRLLTGIRLLLEDALEVEGITLAQLRMLSALRDNGKISSAELARTCFITPQSMQAIVTRAESLGWITRTPSATNRRILSASLTPEGERVLDHGSELYNRMAAQIWSQASIDELRAINTTLEGAIDQLQPLLDALHARHRA